MNRSGLLTQRSLPSALKQTIDDYEVIVVDDGSTDNTAQVMRQYPHVNYLQLPVNRGLSYARNLGISQANAPYVVCLDDDNVLLPNFLKETLAAIGDADAIGVGRKVKYKSFEDYVCPKLGRFTAIDWGWLIRKDVFKAIKYDEKLRANEDTDFGIQFFKRFKAIVIDRPLAIAFDSVDPKDSLSFPTERELNGMRMFFIKNKKEYNDRKELSYLYRLMGRKFYRGGYRWLGIGYFLRAFLSYPTGRTLLNLVMILCGWWVYDKYMTMEERFGAYLRT